MVKRKSLQKIESNLVILRFTSISQDLMINKIHNSGYEIEILIDDVAFNHKVYAWRIINKAKNTWTGSWLYYNPPYFKSEMEAVESAINFCIDKLKIKIL